MKTEHKRSSSSSCSEHCTVRTSLKTDYPLIALGNATILRKKFCSEDFFSNFSSDDNTWLPAAFKWWWRCIFRSHVMKALSILFALFSAMVIWSECTFSLQNPTLSIFAILVRHWASVKNYFNLELFCFITIAYLCLCAYWRLFQIKVDTVK